MYTPLLGLNPAREGIGGFAPAVIFVDLKHHAIYLSQLSTSDHPPE